MPSRVCLVVGGNPPHVLAFVALVGLIAFQLVQRAGEWETDFEAASKEAKASGKYLLLDFTGSDWCGYCIKLKERVFDQDVFKQFADEHLVPVKLDFPRNKTQDREQRRQNRKLAKEYQVTGYPTIILLSPEGEFVGRTGYRRGSAEAYVEHLQAMIDSR